ncbi:MAG: Phosphopantetheine adenylyltransferase [Candidatus Omnitrophica bacterium ADurb.Bin292]|jgi:pantetheine-phosphate adenylyltransferase|nr:MAG: Phosphopantetheine adenylyltransferase [Candidatus Omnitrophica bacterium ADurb.Bin292]HOG24283.1 pantetheine-phosphate adenylyltransferase [Candidatus Omnitrophota bacterium]HPW76501.1 pantetheine-phosphate adenylyltransferase [Candidatus Omnitrophota bacterium]HQB11768.1 pantetheine-phosphate adenylyltransferase [Candidatus Omnitrophota bacterium]
MKKRKAIYPGSFDPVTFGHLDLIERALSLFDSVIVVVASNPAKKTLFTTRERIQFLQNAVKKYPSVRVEYWEGLTVDFAKKVGASTIIRGIRATSDFDYEFQMALTNRHLAPNIDTVFLMPSEHHFFLSSRLAKEIAQMRGDVTKHVPKLVARRLLEKFKG